MAKKLGVPAVVDSSDAKIATCGDPNARLRILVLTDRWQLMGWCTDINEREIKVVNAHCLRQWGTTKGLGQLAMEGPTKSTILDLYGVAYVERVHSLRFELECNLAAWAGKI